SGFSSSWKALNAMTSELRARGAFIILAVAAVGFITTSNRLGAAILRLAGVPGALWLAELCIPSFLSCLLVYLAVRPTRPFALPGASTDWSRLVRLSGGWLLIWLASSAIAALVVGHWIRYTAGMLATLCFVVVGPLQEELYFRGAVLEVAERGWPRAPDW